MYELVLYLCWRPDIPASGAMFGASPLIICGVGTNNMNDIAIYTDEQFADWGDCIDVAVDRGSRLQLRPGWKGLSFTYQCQIVGARE